MADQAKEALRTYRGNCHCGAFVYETEVPEITSVYECDCTICVMKAYLFVLIDPKNLRVIKGDPEKDLTTYKFGTKTVTHKFCPICATAVYVISPSNNMLLNAHAIQGLNTWDLKRTPVKNANEGEPYKPTPHKGELPSAQIENGRLYTGGCHCGKVTLALMTPPLDGTYKERVVECNCSTCERGGFVWVYPKLDQVVLAGDEADIGRYACGKALLAKTFCKTCGTQLTNSRNELDEAAEAALSEELRKWRGFTLEYHPVNIRTLLEAKIGEMTTEKADGWNKIQPMYQNP